MSEPSEPEADKKSSWWYIIGGIVLAVLAAFLLTMRGRHSSTLESRQSNAESMQRDELFDYAIDSLNRQEEFNTNEMLAQAIDRLDRWVENQQPLSDWRPDPMLATLPKPLAELPALADLDRLEFKLGSPSWDGKALQEAVWLRDLSKWARGDSVGDVEHASHLFDWVVRNIQLDRELPTEHDENVHRAIQKPWETLLLGRGTAGERAWVFILLLRQQGLDAAMIGPKSDKQNSGAESTPPRLVGVLSGKDIYLFDPELGLPVPAPDGVRLYTAAQPPGQPADKPKQTNGELVVLPATLAQVVGDDSLLRRLDADAEHPYPLRAEQLDGATVWLEASPWHLAQRMRLVESRLTGHDKMVLTTDPTAQSERFKECAHVGETRLWTLPYESLLQEMKYGPQRQEWQLVTFMPFSVGINEADVLWKGRSYHLKGKFDGTPGAIEYYQQARPSNQQLAQSGMDEKMMWMFLRAKLDASYWLGLVSAYQGNRRAAIDYLHTRTLKVTSTNPWLHGAIYNLARVFEAIDVARSIELYLSDKTAPAHHGNLLRAAWLESLTGVHVELPKIKEPSEKPDEQKPAAEKPDETGPEMPASDGAKPPVEKPEAKPADKPATEPAEKPQADSAEKPKDESAKPADGQADKPAEDAGSPQGSGKAVSASTGPAKSTSGGSAD